jgi:hypothetical protein
LGMFFVHVVFNLTFETLFLLFCVLEAFFHALGQLLVSS